MIVDASVALKWLLNEADTPIAERLLGRDDLLAPELIDLEVAQVLTRRARRRLLAAKADVAEHILALREI